MQKKAKGNQKMVSEKMTSLRDINLFKLTNIISNYNAKLSAITQFDKQYEVLCVVQDTNEILFRRSDKFGKVVLKYLYFFNDTNRCVQDVCFQPSGNFLLILCYDNTLHKVSVSKIFDENLHPYAEIITSYVIPFIGPHQCPNPQTCPNNFEISSLTEQHNKGESNRSSISYKTTDNSTDKDANPQELYSTCKVNEFIATNTLYSNFYGEASVAQEREQIPKEVIETTTDGESIEEKPVTEPIKQDSSEKINKLSKNSTFEDSKSFSTSVETNSYPCPYPTTVLWWQTLNFENRAVVGYSDGTICFVGLSPNCPFIANTSIETGAIDKLLICKDSSLEIISLMITTSLNEQWKFLLEQKSISYTFPGDHMLTNITTDNQPNDLNSKSNNKKIDESENDWQFVINLLENTNIESNEYSGENSMNPVKETTGTDPVIIDDTQLGSDEKIINEQEENAPSGLIPAARARLASLKDLGAKKIGALKMKIAESRLKTNDKVKTKLEIPTLAVMDSPGICPEILTTPSGPYFSVQYFNNKYLLCALHSYSDTLSVHSMDISLVPLFVFKVPKNCKNILLTSNLIYAVQSVEYNPTKETETKSNDDLNSAEKSSDETETETELSRDINVISVISSSMAAIRIGDDCDFNEKALLAQFSFPNERIISIHRRMPTFDKLLIEEFNNFEKETKEKNDFYYIREYNNIKTKLEESENFDVSDVRVMQNKFPDVEYEKCFIVTDKNIYSIDISDYPHIIFLNLANSASWSVCEDFCSTFHLALPQCIEFAGDVFLKKQKVPQALVTYNIARIPPIKTAFKLAMFCECNALMHLCAMALKMSYILKCKHPDSPHIKNLLETANQRIELYSKYKIEVPTIDPNKTVNTGKSCSDFSYENDEISTELQMTNSSQFHISNLLLLTLCEKGIRDRQFLPLWNFLVINTRYHSNLASVILSESGLYAAAILLAQTRGVCLNVFYSLVRIADTNPDEFFDIKILMYNLADKIFMECVTYAHCIALEYFDNIKKHINVLNVDILKKLEKQLNPFNPIYRPIVSKLSCKISDETNGDDFNKEYTEFYKNFIETYMRILIKLKTLTNPEDNFLSALNTFQIHNENNQFALQINDPNPMSAGFSYAACIVDGSAYIWGFNGIYPIFDLHSLETDKSEPSHIPKKISLLSNLNLEVIAIKCGRAHSLLLTNNGLYTLGSNNLGQLGVGKQLTQALQPMLVSALDRKNISMMSAGQYHNGIVADGTLYTWGWGVFGQLGNGRIEDVYTPKVVSFFNEKKIKQISFGYGHSLVLCEELDTTISMYVFGSNHFGQLGIGQYIPSYLLSETECSFLRAPLVKSVKPIKFDFDENIRLIHTRYFANLIVTESNEIYTWGMSPQALRLATQARKRAKASQRVEDSLKNEINKHNEETKKSAEGQSEDGFQNISLAECQSADAEEASESTETENVNTTPEVDAGEPSDEIPESDQESKELPPSYEEDSVDHYFPVKVDSTDVDGDITQLSTGLYHYALMTSKSFLYTWGKNLERQLGHEGQRCDICKPTKLDLVENPLYVECGGDFTLVMTKDFVVKAFGNNNSGQCGKEVSERGYAGRLVRLRVSKRVVRIPDGSQFMELPVDISLPRPKIRMDIDPVCYLKNVPKFHQNYLIKCSLNDTILDVKDLSQNTTIDSNLNELCNETIIEDLKQSVDNLTIQQQNQAQQPQSQQQQSQQQQPQQQDELKVDNKSHHHSSDCITSDEQNNTSAQISSSIVQLNRNHTDNINLNDFIHYCLFIFHGLYDKEKIGEFLKNHKEYKIRTLMLDYKFIDAFKLCITDCLNAQKVIKIFEYFTKDTNIFPMHTEDLKYFIYEIFIHFINNNLQIKELEQFFLNDLELYLIQLAYVLFFNNNNNTDLERQILIKYKNLFGDTEQIINGSLLENSELIFKMVSTNFTVTICQKLIDFGENY